MKRLLDIAYDCGEKNKLDAYLPEGKELPIIVYFHGGGLEGGDKGDENFREIGESFADGGYGFVSVNYRLYGDGAAFPDYITDCAKAIAYITIFGQRADFCIGTVRRRLDCFNALPQSSLP